MALPELCVRLLLLLSLANIDHCQSAVTTLTLHHDESLSLPTTQPCNNCMAVYHNESLTVFNQGDILELDIDIFSNLSANWTTLSSYPSTVASNTSLTIGQAYAAHSDYLYFLSANENYTTELFIFDLTTLQLVNNTHYDGLSQFTGNTTGEFSAFGACLTVLNDELWVIGGLTLVEGQWVPSTHVFKFHTVHMNWTAAPDLPAVRVGAGCAAIDSAHHIYVFGGSIDTNVTTMANETLLWDGTAWNVLNDSDLPHPREFLWCTYDFGQLIYCIGGFPQPVIDVFNINSNLFEQVITSSNWFNATRPRIAYSDTEDVIYIFDHNSTEFQWMELDLITPTPTETTTRAPSPFPTESVAESTTETVETTEETLEGNSEGVQAGLIIIFVFIACFVCLALCNGCLALYYRMHPDQEFVEVDVEEEPYLHGDNDTVGDVRTNVTTRDTEPFRVTEAEHEEMMEMMRKGSLSIGLEQ